jgi:hypothetical protein
MKRLGGIVLMAFAALSLHAPAALAAKPPSPPYAPGKPPNNIGPKPHGSTFVVTSCGFKANTTVWVYLNDVFVETDTTGANGCADQTVVINCNGPTATIDGHVTPAKNGSNDLTVGGPKPNGQVNSVTTRFEITGCGSGKKYLASGNSLAFTDAAAIGDAAASADSAAPAGAVAGSSRSRGTLAFTGSNWMRLTAVALALILLGGLIVRRERVKVRLDR